MGAATADAEPCGHRRLPGPLGHGPGGVLRQLGIERVQALVNDEPWTLVRELSEKVERDAGGGESLEVDAKVVKALREEQDRRAENCRLIAEMKAKDPSLAKDPVLQRWAAESRPLPSPLPGIGALVPVRRVMGDPAWFKDLMNLAKATGVRVPNLYGYDRAFANPIAPKPAG